MDYINYSKSLFISLGLCVILSLAGCKKENQSPNTTPNTTTSTLTGTPTQTNNSPYFLTGSLSGESVNAIGSDSYFNDSTAATTSNGGCEGDGGQVAGGNGDPDDLPATKVTGGKWTTTVSSGVVTTAVVEMERLAVRVYVAPKTVTRFDMVAPGVYGFASSTISGAYIAVLDKQGVVWTTIGDQTGSVFEITSRGDSTGVATTFGGTFTAKMYNSSGAAKQITNGKFNSLAGL